MSWHSVRPSLRRMATGRKPATRSHQPTLEALEDRLVPAALIPGFTETQVASNLGSVIAMDFAPDGRLFVCQQAGALRVIKNGTLLPTPFVR